MNVASKFPRRDRFALAYALFSSGLALCSAALAQDAHNREAGARTGAETPEFHLARGHDDLKSDRYEAAVREFRAALALDPRLTLRARFPLAVALFDIQDRQNARAEFEKVRAETGDNPNVTYYLGRLDLMEGHLDAAIKNLTLAAAEPPFPDTAYYLAYAYYKKGDLASAEQWLKKAAALAPGDFRIHERLGLLYQATGRKEEAQKAFALSAELHRNDTQYTQMSLDCSHKLDTQPFEEARAFCQQLYDPQNVGKLVTLGAVYGQHGDYADAVEPFRRAAELEPDSYELQYDLGLTYFRLKRYREARAPLEKATWLRPDIFEVNAPLGAVLYALGDDLPAYQVLAKAHRMNPENADVNGLLFKVSTLLAQQSITSKEYAVALQYLLKAAELSPRDASTHRRLADVYSALGEKTKAGEEQQEAQRLGANTH